VKNNRTNDLTVFAPPEIKRSVTVRIKWSIFERLSEIAERWGERADRNIRGSGRMNISYVVERLLDVASAEELATMGKRKL